MALRAGYYGVKRFLRDKLETIVGTYDETIKSLFPRSEQAVLGAGNFCDTSNAINATSLVSAVNEDGIVTFKDETTPKWSNSYIGKAHIENGKTYYIMTNTKNPLVYGRIAINKSATQDPSQSDTANITVLDGETKTAILTPSIGIASFVANETADVYLWYCNDRDISTKHAVFSAGFMIALSADTPYAPYAMTNRELTDSVAELTTSASDQKTAINAIITAATEAADFAAFKTAMSAITPVTRSLSLTKEDLTEEVKEDVEPEKTVTKKRTAKKTEEV